MISEKRILEISAQHGAINDFGKTFFTDDELIEFADALRDEFVKYIVPADTGDLLRDKQDSWLYLEQGDANQYCLITQNNKWLVAVQLNGELLTEHQKIIMQRIVACVNACEGIDIQYLESPDNLATHARSMMMQRDAFRKSTSELVNLFGKRGGDLDDLLPAEQQEHEVGKAMNVLEHLK